MLVPVILKPSHILKNQEVRFMFDLIVIGAGPAGLTAAYELLDLSLIHI